MEIFANGKRKIAIRGQEFKRRNLKGDIITYCANVSNTTQFRQRSRQLPKLLEGDMTHGHKKIMAARGS